MNSTSELGRFLDETRRLVDARLAALAPPETAEPKVVTAPIREALLAPGKRLRPAVMLAVGALFRARSEELLEVACAVEMIHGSSLIFDDLPAMDDAEMRRGRPTLHRSHGEAMAMLAGIELLHRAFGLLAEAAERRRGFPLAALSRLLSDAIGVGGVVGGQAVDLTAVAGVDLATLEFIHAHKTGALFTAAADAGAILGGARPAQRQAVRAYAKNLGLAFQITDDILDATSTPAALGKDVGKDADKSTFVSLLGVAAAAALAAELTTFAETALAPFGKNAERLVELARFVRDRRA